MSLAEEVKMFKSALIIGLLLTYLTVAIYAQTSDHVIVIPKGQKQSMSVKGLVGASVGSIQIA
jgi:hypothetical protein